MALYRGAAAAAGPAVIGTVMATLLAVVKWQQQEGSEGSGSEAAAAVGIEVAGWMQPAAQGTTAALQTVIGRRKERKRVRLVRSPPVGLDQAAVPGPERPVAACLLPAVAGVEA